MLFERERFGNAGKTKGDVFLDFEIPLRRCFPDVHGFLKELPVAQSLFPANIGHSFRPSSSSTSTDLLARLDAMLKIHVFSDDSPRKVSIFAWALM